MKCTSRNTRKTRMKVTFGYGFKTTTMPGKLRHPSFTQNVFVNKLSVICRDSISAISGPKFSSSNYPCTSFQTNAMKKIDEYRIENTSIINDILEFRKVALIFIKMHNSKNQGKYIDVKNDTGYLLLKCHDETITSLQMFREMKLEDVITDKVFFTLACL